GRMRPWASRQPSYQIPANWSISVSCALRTVICVLPCRQPLQGISRASVCCSAQQVLAKQPLGSEDASLDSRHLFAESGSDFSVGQLAIVVQNQQDAVFAWQAAQRFADVFLLFTAQHVRKRRTIEALRQTVALDIFHSATGFDFRLAELIDAMAAGNFRKPGARLNRVLFSFERM